MSCILGTITCGAMYIAGALHYAHSPAPSAWSYAVYAAPIQAPSHTLLPGQVFLPPTVVPYFVPVPYAGRT